MVTLAVIGCGQRGKAYAEYALHSSACKIVAIAEPRPKTRAQFKAAHNVDDTLVFENWESLYEASSETLATIGTRLADAVIIAVQDHLHFQVALKFAEQGYHILCEKPMSVKIEECIRMEAAIKRAGVIFATGHVLRYSQYNQEIVALVRSGTLGKLVNIVHVEPIGFYHFAHSYVRGNWSKEKDSAFSLMTKSCHDIDILCHYFSPALPLRVSSFGSLHHFNKSSKPKAAGNTTKCLDCPIEKECPYSAKKIYLDPVSRGNTGWPVDTIIDGIPDIENVTEMLRNGPFGKCVYESDNDVCDHQVVNMEFSGGATASFTFVAYSSLICERQTRMHFTHGEIIGDMSSYTVTDFRKTPMQAKKYHPKNTGGGHGGGDLGLIQAFVEAVCTGNQKLLGTDVEDVLRSHLCVFAAETSRKEGNVVDVERFSAEAKRHWT